MPQRTSDQALAIAQAILAGFDRHYALFRYNAQQAKSRYEAADWHAIRQLARERIAFYDERVREAVARIEDVFGATDLAAGNWAQVKRHFVALLAEHRQPELAETFFNSVCAKLLHRTYFHNDFIFVRPAVATDYLDGDPPSYRAYYPAGLGLRRTLRQMIVDLGLACPFVDIDRDLALVTAAMREFAPEDAAPATDCQLNVLRTLFYRNKGAYLIGRYVADGEVTPFAIPILQDGRGRLFLDTLLHGSERIETLFNFSRAYFMVDMEVPSAYVRFLKSLMPTKPESELYTMLGLHKQGKTAFYRDMLAHLKHSHDKFVIAPGIKGLVMGVFTLPSFPYVFKIIKDKRHKDVSREFIQKQYQLVKFHDRVGRMADTWEYSDVPFPKARFDQALLDELRATAPSIIEEDADTLVIKHLYIERRMIPLNMYLERCTDAEREHALIEYGDAIKQMVAADIFPGDMLYKNFGVTRQGRVVFYDYDEVAYVTDCVFRRIPEPRTPEEEMASEPWYRVGPHDVFPEEFGTFLLGDPRVRRIFEHHHGDLLDAAFWQRKQAHVRAGRFDDVFPYPESVRFRNRYDQVEAASAGGPARPAPDAAAPAPHARA
ncbi:MAG: bifunctional isocitrate dehydrogenase kinase/phosphatase [Burkholderiales bacterium]|nr:MAG: bifunctional isocitrate dehydrogenase kinase/phosphatase [Burkholderiales bacterium]